MKQFLKNLTFKPFLLAALILMIPVAGLLYWYSEEPAILIGKISTRSTIIAGRLALVSLGAGIISWIISYRMDGNKSRRRDR